MERSYNPKNYNDFLGRNMEKAYRILETKQAEREYGELQCAVDNIYFEIKEMIKWNEIEKRPWAIKQVQMKDDSPVIDKETYFIPYNLACVRVNVDDIYN